MDSTKRIFSEKVGLHAFNTLGRGGSRSQRLPGSKHSVRMLGQREQRRVSRSPIDNLDVSMFKNIPIRGERLWAQFRVEAYNVLNHTQFTTVNTTAQFNPTTGAPTNPLFGQYTATAAPRRLQLALRVSF